MNVRPQKKEREKRSVEVLRALLKDFPDGQILTDEGQERPDIVVAGESQRIGIVLKKRVSPKDCTVTRTATSAFGAATVFTADCSALCTLVSTVPR